MKVDWSQMKNFIDTRGVSPQVLDCTSCYKIVAIAYPFTIEHEMDRDPSDTTDLDEFEAGYLASANGKTVVSQAALPEPGDFHARLEGVFSVSPPANITTTYTYTLAADRYIDGALWESYTFEFGDKVSIEIHHPVAGLVEVYTNNWYCTAGTSQFRLYKGFIPAGMEIKLLYTNVHATNTAKFSMNLFLHEKVAS